MAGSAGCEGGLVEKSICAKATTKTKKALPLSKGERVTFGVCCLSHQNAHLKSLSYIIPVWLS